MNSKGFFRAGFFKIAFVCICATLLTSAWAQSRYSLNTVGYVDANFLTGSNLIANPLNNGVNTMASLFRSLPDGSFFLPWNQQSQSFDVANSYNQSGGWTDPNAVFVAPNGGFLWLPSPAQITFVGEPWIFGGPLSNTYCVSYGNQTVSSVVPRGQCGLCSDYSSCSPAVPEGTSMWKWNRSAQRWITYIFVVGDWYDQSFNIVDPQLEADESGVFYFSGAFQATAPGRGTPIERSDARLQQLTRNGANLSFQFPTTNSTAYVILCSTNLASNVWRVAQGGIANPTGGVASITISAVTNTMAFYRLVGAATSTNTILLNPSRSGTRFECQFYAPIAATYEFQRVLTLTNPPLQSWQTIATVTAAPSNIVTVTDATATGGKGYYRLRY